MSNLYTLRKHSNLQSVTVNQSLNNDSALKRFKETCSRIIDTQKIVITKKNGEIIDCYFLGREYACIAYFFSNYKIEHLFYKDILSIIPKNDFTKKTQNT